ncbi:MAG: hypothetical protein DDT21_02416 [Syntrophomonadaceae bacterium]|nr:hypothetical protein [Bacillota bacterium]
MSSVLVICGHVGIEHLTEVGLCPGRDVAQLRRGTGSRGEREWTGHVGQLLADSLRARGVGEVKVHDATYAEAVYERDWDLVISLHYARDADDARAFAAAPNPGGGYVIPAAGERAARWLARFVDQYELLTGIPVTQWRVTANMTDWYGWCFVWPDTAAVLVEAGHADLDAAVLYEPGVVRVVGALATITEEFLAHDLGIALATTDRYPLATFPVAGVWEHDLGALEAVIVDYTDARAPAGIGWLYAELGARVGVRADVLVAQAMHETGRFAYGGGDPIFSADPSFHNFAGIKTTDGTATARFSDARAGVTAHAHHAAWYVHPDHVDGCSMATDPRHFGSGHPANVRVIDDLGGKWAPSPEYGRGVARHLAEIRARVAAWSPAPRPRPLPDIAADLDEITADLVDLAEELRRRR